MSDEVAARSTELLRGSDEPPWPRLRALPSTEGFQPSEVALATLFPDDVDTEFGVVVSRDGRVHEFELHYGSQG